MKGINKVMLIGRVGKDKATIRYTQGGLAVSNFSMATNEDFTGADGKKVERTEWHKIVTFGKLAEICAKHLDKGKPVYVEGRLQTRKWDDKDGITRYTTEVVASTLRMLDKAPESSAYTKEEQAAGLMAAETTTTITDDDIPF